MKKVRLKTRHLIATRIVGVDNWWSDAHEWTPIRDDAMRFLRLETARRKAGALRNQGYDATVSTIAE